MTICGHERVEERRQDGHFMVCNTCKDKIYSSLYPDAMYRRAIRTKEGVEITKRLFGKKFAKHFYKRVKPLSKGE